MRQIVILLLLIACFSCQKKNQCNLDETILRANDSVLLKFKSEKTISQLLKKLKEPELTSLSGETYRFMILSSFGYYKSYRINKNIKGYSVISKNFLRSSDEKIIDSLYPEKQTYITIQNWLEIKKLIDDIHFWTIPVRIKDNHYLDGAAYLIEGYNSEKNECTNRFYQATVRICPNDTTKYKLLFNKIIKLTSK